MEKIELHKLLKIAIEAGEIILKVYNSDFTSEQKEDGTPVTAADRKASKVIIKELKDLYPDIPVLCEEGRIIPYEVRKNWEYFWLVDPLDGTKEFVSRKGEFTVNIALIHKNKPVLGVIYVPVLNILYYAQEGKGAYKVEKASLLETCGDDEMLVKFSRKLPLTFPGRSFTVVGSRSHMSPETREYINKLKFEQGEIDLITSGSSVKFCLLAEGKADVYPRLGLTKEWDIAAGHILVNEAGKKVYRYNTAYELVYNKQDLDNPWFVVK